MNYLIPRGQAEDRLLMVCQLVKRRQIFDLLYRARSEAWRAVGVLKRAATPVTAPYSAPGVLFIALSAIAVEGGP